MTPLLVYYQAAVSPCVFSINAQTQPIIPSHYKPQLFLQKATKNLDNTAKKETHSAF